MAEVRTMKTGLAGSLALGLVFIPDRRGRGLSGPYREHHSVEKECEDTHALINPGIKRWIEKALRLRRDKLRQVVPLELMKESNPEQTLHFYLMLENGILIRSDERDAPLLERRIHVKCIASVLVALN
jgi:hypothetical protein